MQGVVSGTVSQPAVAVTLQGSELTAYNETLGSLTARMNMEGREILLEQLVLDKPQPDRNGRVSVTGRYHLDRKSYTFDLRSEDVRLVSATLPQGQGVRGEVELLARGTGTVASPAADVHLEADDLRIVVPVAPAGGALPDEGGSATSTTRGESRSTLMSLTSKPRSQRPRSVSTWPRMGRSVWRRLIPPR